MFVRRTFSAGLETSSDGTSWNRCADLSEHGIEPLDLQLSLISPTVFGRLTIDQAEDTRTLLSLMLGYDDLEALGDFVSKLAGNRTRLANEEQGDLDAQRAQLVQKLQSLPDMLPSQHDLRDRLTNLSQMRNPAQSDIAEVGQLTKRNISTAEASLAELLGLPETGRPPPDGIADKLTTAIAALEKGVFPNFPSLRAIRLEEALPQIESSTPTERLAAMQASVDGFLSSAKSRIAQRLEWWRKETQPGSKVALLLRAAQDYDAASAQCPVCEQSIMGLPIERELAQLGKLDRELMRDLSTFFRDLVDEFRRIVPEALTALAESTAQQRIMQDWKNLCEAVIDPVFAPITAKFDEAVRTIAEQARVAPAATVSLLPEDALNLLKRLRSCSRPSEGAGRPLHAAVESSPPRRNWRCATSASPVGQRSCFAARRAIQGEAGSRRGGAADQGVQGAPRRVYAVQVHHRERGRFGHITGAGGCSQ